MPRLTNHDYLSTRHFLAALWEQSGGSFFAVLPGYAQRDLHDYFAFTVQMDDADALWHRVQMTTAFPSLPQATGRALGAVKAHVDGRSNRLLDQHRAAMTRLTRVAGENRIVRVETVSRPDVDLDALRTALHQLDEGKDSTAL